MEKIFSFFVVLALAFGGFNLSAQTQNVTGDIQKGNESSPVNVGNKICPVTGEKIDEKTTYEYQGKIYNFCCAACIDEFKKDPQKYIKKVDEELQAATNKKEPTAPKK